RALDLARELGAEIGECRLPRSVEFGLPCYYLIAPSEASSNLARYDGVRYGLRSTANGDVRSMYDRTRHDGFGDEPKRRIMLGTYALSAGYYEAFYGQAQKVRTVIRDEHAAAFEQFDVLASPNTPTCPVCLAFPGSLPVPNRKAVEWTVLLGLGLGCEIAEHAVFHRKNYFYPDNPKGYQISQYDEPLCVNGRVPVPGADGDVEVGIVRAHLEEDAAKTVHVGGAEGRIHGAES